MAALTAGVTGSYVGYLAQRAFLGPEGRQRKLKAAHTRAAQRMTSEFLTLRGPAMKLGQTLSLQAGLLPEEMLRELAELQMSAPGMHPTLARAQFKASMGKAPEELFRSFTDEPFAAASLGQVHHAVSRDGTRLAVKIQYPGIRAAVANDFRWFRTVSRGAQLTRHLPALSLAELEAQILAETDYGREADNLEHFRERLAPLPFVSVPRVYREYSGEGVLTMELLTGAHLDGFLAARPTQRIRDTLGARLVELFYFQVLEVEAFHADPHWGNYLFGKDGTIGLVDFGCVKYLDSRFVQTLRALYLYPGDRTGPGFQEQLTRRHALYGQKLTSAGRKALARFAENFYRTVYPPEVSRDDQPFDFAGDAFLKTYMRESANLAKSKCALPEYLMMARAETGLYATLHRLRARVPMSRIVRRHLGKGRPHRFPLA
jgi:predicted unusual protein kinase regulating ubiquinone biosynthesis (AarF/ABC1/UbiB family)